MVNSHSGLQNKPTFWPVMKQIRGNLTAHDILLRYCHPFGLSDPNYVRLGLSNEVMNILLGQGFAKLPTHKVDNQKN